MKQAALVLLILAFPLAVVPRQDLREPSPEEKKLHEIINAYRQSRGLPAIGLSKSLTHVAKVHAEDLQANRPSGGCNMHSWSKNGPWSPCCYTPNHAQAKCMWNKPRELTGYPGNGYECSSMYSGQMTAEQALGSWKGSAGHNAVIVSEGIWARFPWKSMGAGISENYAVIWFGNETDPAGYWQ